MMTNTLLILISGLIGLVATSTTQQDYEGQETALFQSLVTRRNYDKRLKPTLRAKDQITVFFSFGLARIESLDEKRQVMSSFGWLVANWYDRLLTWNATEEGVDRIVVPSENIWLPEIAMLNSIEEAVDLTLDTNFRVNIDSDGQVSWSAGLRWRTTCKIELTYFPFDRQTCEVQFINWIYAVELLNFTMRTSAVRTTAYTENGEWDLVFVDGYSFRRGTGEDLSAQYPMIILRVTLKRIPTYFVMNVVIPSVLITFLSIVVFWLPFESGEKVSLSITVLLSLSIVLLMISDVTPRNGNSLPILSWYVVATMNMAGISLITTVGVLNICHHNPSQPIPTWLDKLVFNTLAPALCLSTRRTPSRAENAVHIFNNDVEEKGREMKREAWRETELISNDPKHSLLPRDILDYVRSNMEKEKEQTRIEANRDQWIRLGKVLDRFLLVLWLTVVSMTTVILFLFLAGAD